MGPKNLDTTFKQYEGTAENLREIRGGGGEAVDSSKSMGVKEIASGRKGKWYLTGSWEKAHMKIRCGIVKWVSSGVGLRLKKKEVRNSYDIRWYARAGQTTRMLEAGSLQSFGRAS